jgi:hypothetical protein
MSETHTQPPGPGEPQEPTPAHSETHTQPPGPGEPQDPTPGQPGQPQPTEHEPHR